VGPGCVLSWTEEARVHIDAHSPTAAFFCRRSQSKEDYTSDVVDAFGAAVRRAQDPPGTIGMSLSGGLDSRAILSALTDPARVHTYTLGIAGCADEAVARRLSALTGSPHEFHELDSRYLQGFLDQLRAMVSLTDGMYLSHGLTEMLALGFLRRAPFTVLLRGHCGEMAKMNLAWPVHTDATVYGLTSRPQVIDYLLGRLTFIAGGLNWPELFTGTYRDEMRNGARMSLDQSLRDAPLSPAEQCGYIYLHEYYRRMTIPSLELFRTAVEIRTPFADEEFLSVLLSGPSEWRDSTDLHRAIISHHRAALLRVRDSNTGAAVNASPLRAAFDDKVNSLLKRLNVRGYRHYHNFDEWMERNLIETVEIQLLAPRALDRRLLEEERLREVISGARAGRRGHAYLLQVLLLLELWQQENLDGQPVV
jgi:asparagine synthase (glutamine-hydrolysing)